MDVRRDVAAVMGQQLDQVMGLRVHQHPPLGDADVSSADAFSQRVHQQGSTWGAGPLPAPGGLCHRGTHAWGRE